MMRRNEAARRRRGIAAIGLAAATLVAATAMARAEEPTGRATFACKDGKSIEATFYSDKVDLKLSDGRTMTLPQTMSGSGIRYANADETVVFWSKGNTAFVTEGADEKETFSDCVAPQ
jgi:membrane-bound inhibitor of C-type lysozyme